VLLFVDIVGDFVRFVAKRVANCLYMCGVEKGSFEKIEISKQHLVDMCRGY